MLGNSNYFEGNFCKENNTYIVNKLKEDYKKKTFKNVIIIPIKSFERFIEDIEYTDKMKNLNKNILLHFNKFLIPEQQPFFLLIDNDENDFNKRIFNYQIKKDDDSNKDNNFVETIINTYKKFQRKESDFEITTTIILEKKDSDKIKDFKDLILKKKNIYDDFEIIINKKYYRFLYGQESCEIQKFFEIFEGKDETFIILLIIINENMKLEEELEIYKKLEVKLEQIEFKVFDFEIEKMKKILERYSELDSRNFSVVRFKKSIKNQLLKYTGYYNQLGDILFCEEASKYPIKINIAVGGFIGSGKSTLINTIFGEKRCLEAQGCSQTNYISQYTLKDYPISFIDFPGFRAKKDDLDNSNLFIDNIKSKISDLKKTNEIIHCFLFCIKYEERLFDSNEEETKKIFKILAQFKLKTFFIITQSEEPDSTEFIRFKENLINEIDQINYSEEERKSVFGEDLEEQIIPIFSIKKISHKNLINPFGLDKLFESLYKYFYNKRIKNEINFNNINDKELQELINNNELLRIFKSKKEVINGFKQKLEKEVSIFIFKFFLIAPSYLYNITEEKLEDLLVDITEHSIELYFNYIGKQDYSEKLRLLKDMSITKYNIKERMQEFPKIITPIKNELEKKIPWYVKAIFPILSPIYYTIGTLLIKVFSGEISRFITEKIWNDEMFADIINNYFKNIIETFNLAIEDLNIISKNFNIIYKKNKI